MAESGTYGTHTGIVKWFSNRKGYGFLTIVSEEMNGDDIFVHQTYVTPKTSEYRALSAGEYVAFNIKDGTDQERSQAIDVTGVCGGPLQCDRPQPPRVSQGGRGTGTGRGRGIRTTRPIEVDVN